MAPEDTVRIRQNDDFSQKRKVVRMFTQVRLITDKGTVLRRTRRHLLKTKESFTVDPEIDYDNITVKSPEIV